MKVDNLCFMYQFHRRVIYRNNADNSVCSVSAPSLWNVFLCSKVTRNFTKPATFGNKQCLLGLCTLGGAESCEQRFLLPL